MRRAPNRWERTLQKAERKESASLPWLEWKREPNTMQDSRAKRMLPVGPLWDRRLDSLLRFRSMSGSPERRNKAEAHLAVVKGIRRRNAMSCLRPAYPS